MSKMCHVGLRVYFVLKDNFVYLQLLDFTSWLKIFKTVPRIYQHTSRQEAGKYHYFLLSLIVIILCFFIYLLLTTLSEFLSNSVIQMHINYTHDLSHSKWCIMKCWHGAPVQKIFWEQLQVFGACVLTFSFCLPLSSFPVLWDVLRAQYWDAQTGESTFNPCRKKTLLFPSYNI